MNRKDTIYIVVSVGVAIWLVLEHRARREQDRQIAALEQQLGQMTEQVADAGGQMSNLVTQARQFQVQRIDQTREVAQLREEVRVLHRQADDVQTLRSEVNQVRATVEGGNGQYSSRTATANSRTGPTSSRLQILEAYYWSPNKIIDVTRQLSDRVADDRLEIIAGNDLRGDPEFGQVKTLTVLYKYDGVTLTNEVREGGLLLIPEGQ